MKNLLLTFAIMATLFSCNTDEEIIDRIEKSWNLQSVEGITNGIEILSTWERIEIEDRTFTLFNTTTDLEESEEVEVATGRIEYCDVLVLHNCYQFIIESKSTDSNLALEFSNNKIVTYLNDELSLTAICCDDVSYFLN